MGASVCEVYVVMVDQGFRMLLPTKWWTYGRVIDSPEIPEPAVRIEWQRIASCRAKAERRVTYVTELLD